MAGEARAAEKIRAELKVREPTHPCLALYHMFLISSNRDVPTPCLVLVSGKTPDSLAPPSQPLARNWNSC
eukprot:6012958-Pyramimonas_sp.AAC.1